MDPYVPETEHVKKVPKGVVVFTIEEEGEIPGWIAGSWEVRGLGTACGIVEINTLMVVGIHTVELMKEIVKYVT